MITPSTFRATFPEFTTVEYPDAVVNQWIAIGVMMLPTESWGLGSDPAVSPPTAIYDFGLMLFVAHNLVLEKQAMDAANSGGVPGGGGATGVVSSEAVGSVSRSYDTNAGLNLDAGPWNLTTYGTRFIFLARLRGKGPLQIGPPQGLAGYGVSVGGWFGPPVDGNGGFSW